MLKGGWTALPFSTETGRSMIAQDIFMGATCDHYQSGEDGHDSSGYAFETATDVIGGGGGHGKEDDGTDNEEGGGD